MAQSVPTTDEVRARLAALLPELRQRYGVRSLALFGSYARGEQTPESDVDVLVEFGGTPSLYTLGGLTVALQDALGRRVQVEMASDLPPDIRRSAEADKVSV